MVGQTKPRMYKANHSQSASYMRYLKGELKALSEYVNENCNHECAVTIEEVQGFPKIRVRVDRFHILVTRFSMAQYRIMHFCQLTEEEKHDNEMCNINIHNEVDQYEATDFKGVVERLNKLDYVLYT